MIHKDRLIICQAIISVISREKNIHTNMCLRTTLLWFVTQGVVVIYYRRFGTNEWSNLKGSRIQIYKFFWIIEDGTDRFCRKAGKKLPQLAAQ
jgi:hypothetical protein